MIQHLDWLATAFSFAGLYLLPRHHRRAVITWMIGNLVWATWAVYTGNWAILVMQVVLSALHVRTLLTWRGVQNA